MLLILAVLILLGISLRLYDLTDQPIDFHPTRQLRGAIVARGMYYEMSASTNETDRQQAKAFWSSTGQYEPSILERLVAITYLWIGKEIFWLVRIYNTIFWIMGGLILFDLARRMTSSLDSVNEDDLNRKVSFFSALLATAYFLVLPFSVQASRSFQPDPSMVVWIVLSSYSVYRWSEKVFNISYGHNKNPVSIQNRDTWIWAILTGLFSGLAILTKAVAFYTVAITTLTMVLCAFGAFRSKPFLSPIFRILRTPQIWSMFLLMITPTAVYYLSRGGRVSEYFSSWTLALSHLILEPNTYSRWLNLIQDLMTWTALLMALLGIYLAKRHNRALLLGLWLGYLAYGLFLPYQMYTHSYYHLQLVFLIALSISPVFQWILGWLLRKDKVWQILFAGFTLIVLMYYCWQALIPLYSQDYRNEPAYWQEIASHLPTDGKVIALTQDYGYRLMYYGWRKVSLWPNRGEINLSNLRDSSKDFQEYFAKRTNGKSYFLVTAFRQFEDQPILKQTLFHEFSISAEGPGYILFNLTKPNADNSRSLP